MHWVDIFEVWPVILISNGCGCPWNGGPPNVHYLSYDKLRWSSHLLTPWLWYMCLCYGSKIVVSHVAVIKKFDL